MLIIAKQVPDFSLVKAIKYCYNEYFSNFSINFFLQTFSNTQPR
jgi:hypothetical protein